MYQDRKWECPGCERELQYQEVITGSEKLPGSQGLLVTSKLMALVCHECGVQAWEKS